MQATVADVNPKTLESAKRQFVELYGSALVLNTYLKIALVLVSLVALGLIGLNIHTANKYADVKPLVIRIDDVGRAERSSDPECEPPAQDRTRLRHERSRGQSAHQAVRRDAADDATAQRFRPFRRQWAEG